MEPIKVSKMEQATEMTSVNHPEIEFENSDEYQEPVFASVMRAFGCCMGYFCLPISCGCCCRPYQNVEKGYVGVIQEFGRVKREVKDGMYYVNPVTEQLQQVNVKIQVVDLDNKSMVTSDLIPVNIDSVVAYKITKVDDALFKVDNIRNSIIELSYTTLRNVIGSKTLKNLLSNRIEIAEAVKEIVDENVHKWGVAVEFIQIKDINVPKDTMTSLSSAATSEREGEAKIISARAEVESAKLMREASDILNTEAAMQIRYLETMQKIGSSNNSKIVFMPMDSGFKMENVSKAVVAQEMLDD